MSDTSVPPTTPAVFSKALQVQAPPQEACFPVPLAEWEYLRSRIQALKAAAPILHTIASITAGVCGSAAITGLALGGEVSQTSKALVWAVAVAAALLTALGFFAARRDSAHEAATTKQITDEMDRIKVRYGGGSA